MLLVGVGLVHYDFGEDGAPIFQERHPVLLNVHRDGAVGEGRHWGDDRIWLTIDALRRLRGLVEDIVGFHMAPDTGQG